MINEMEYFGLIAAQCINVCQVNLIALKCIKVYFNLQEEIVVFLLHPHLNIVFGGTKHGVFRAYDFQNEVRNYYQKSYKWEMRIYIDEW